MIPTYWEKKPCPNAALFATNLIRNEMETKLLLSGERPANNGTSRDTKFALSYAYRFSPYRAVNTLRLSYKTNQLMLYRE